MHTVMVSGGLPCSTTAAASWRGREEGMWREGTAFEDASGSSGHIIMWPTDCATTRVPPLLKIMHQSPTSVGDTRHGSSTHVWYHHGSAPQWCRECRLCVPKHSECLTVIGAYASYDTLVSLIHGASRPVQHTKPAPVTYTWQRLHQRLSRPRTHKPLLHYHNMH